MIATTNQQACEVKDIASSPKLLESPVLAFVQNVTPTTLPKSSKPESPATSTPANKWALTREFDFSKVSSYFFRFSPHFLNKGHLLILMLVEALIISQIAKCFSSIGPGIARLKGSVRDMFIFILYRLSKNWWEANNHDVRSLPISQTITTQRTYSDWFQRAARNLTRRCRAFSIFSPRSLPQVPNACFPLVLYLCSPPIT